MLRIGKVYKYENDMWYVESRKKYRRVLYTIRRVTTSGMLAESKEVPFKREKFILQTDIKVRIIIELPQKTVADMMYNNLVTATKKLIGSFNRSSPDARKNNYRIIAQNCLASLGHFDRSRGVHITLRIFAKDLGLKNAGHIYRLVTQYYAETCPDSKYTKAIKEATDTTIISSFKQTQITMKYLHGFNKQLDYYLERELAGYANELKARKIDLAMGVSR